MAHKTPTMKLWSALQYVQTQDGVLIRPLPPVNAYTAEDALALLRQRMPLAPRAMLAIDNPKGEIK